MIGMTRTSNVSTRFGLRQRVGLAVAVVSIVSSSRDERLASHCLGKQLHVARSWDSTTRLEVWLLENRQVLDEMPCGYDIMPRGSMSSIR